MTDQRKDDVVVNILIIRILLSLYSLMNTIDQIRSDQVKPDQPYAMLPMLFYAT